MQAPNGDCIINDHFKRGGKSPSDHFRDQTLWHWIEKNDDSAWYQPQQGGLATFLDHFGIIFLIMRVMILHGINPNRVD